MYLSLHGTNVSFLVRSHTQAKVTSRPCSTQAAMEKFGAIGEEVEEGVDKDGDDFLFLFPADECLSGERATKVEAEVLA